MPDILSFAEKLEQAAAPFTAVGEDPAKMSWDTIFQIYRTDKGRAERAAMAKISMYPESLTGHQYEIMKITAPELAAKIGPVVEYQMGRSQLQRLRGRKKRRRRRRAKSRRGAAMAAPMPMAPANGAGPLAGLPPWVLPAAGIGLAALLLMK